MAKFITIEGQDGAGKSSNIEVIQRCLSEAGIEFIVTREPGGTQFGERVRELLLSSNDTALGDLPELLLIFAARAQHLVEVIEPALANNTWVICDRFTDATYAYQGGGRGLDFQVIAQLETLVQGQRRPDLTLLLDLDVEHGERRAGARSEPDRFEVQQQAFKQRVRDCYLERAKQEPQRFRVVDASQDLVEVQVSVANAIHEFIRHVNHG